MKLLDCVTLLLLPAEGLSPRQVLAAALIPETCCDPYAGESPPNTKIAYDFFLEPLAIHLLVVGAVVALDKIGHSQSTSSSYRLKRRRFANLQREASW
jgi:hypothetical protein